MPAADDKKKTGNDMNEAVKKGEKWRLVLQRQDSEQTYLAEAGPDEAISAGRSYDVKLPLPEYRSISRNQCVFSVKGSKLFAEDKGSSNGTFYVKDGKWTRLEKDRPAALNSEGYIRMADQTFRYTVTIISEGSAPFTPPAETEPELRRAIQKTYPGLTMYVRDANLQPDMVEKYRTGMIIREKAFTDASYRVMGMVTTHRYAILSNHMTNLEKFEHGTNWGLCTAGRYSRFKVLGKHEYRGKTLIILLHLPDDESWKLFKDTVIDVDGDLVYDCVRRFEDKFWLKPVPQLTSDTWLSRCCFPVGMSDTGELFPIE